jgi:serine protease Do
MLKRNLLVPLFCLYFTVLGVALPVHGEEDPAIDAALQLQGAFTKVAEQASPAVVVITNKQTMGPQAQMPQGVPPEFRYFFGIPEEPEAPPPSRQLPRPVGRGSGVVVRPNGYVVTNYHVIQDHEALEVKLHDGTVFDSEREGEVEVVGYDRETDLAVLKLAKAGVKKFPHLKFGNSDDIRVGHWVIAVGAPFNFDYSVTVGVVSQKGRYDVRMNTYENYIQTDASINPGNSGGPLLNLRGEVIGINDFIVTGGGMSRGNVGIGFAIASNLASEIVDDLIENGEVVRPWMGIAMQAMDGELRQQFGVDYGVLISDVMEGDPAERAGLQAGDVILQVNGKRMNSAHDVQFAVLKNKPGAKVQVLVDREGKQKTFEVKLRQKDGEMSAAAAVEEERDVLEELGMALEAKDGEVVVTGVVGGSSADAAGLRRGDVICEVNREEVTTVQEVVEALKATKKDMALVCRERRGMKAFVTLKLRDADGD